MATTSILAFPLSGSFVPSGGNNVNISAIGYSAYYFTKTGLDVTVHGSVSIQATAPGATSGEIDIPIAADFTIDRQLSGVMTGGKSNLTVNVIAMTAAVANNKAAFRFEALDNSAYTYNYTFTYRLV